MLTPLLIRFKYSLQVHDGLSLLLYLAAFQITRGRLIRFGGKEQLRRSISVRTQGLYAQDYRSHNAIFRTPISTIRCATKERPIRRCEKKAASPINQHHPRSNRATRGDIRSKLLHNGTSRSFGRQQATGKNSKGNEARTKQDEAEISAFANSMRGQTCAFDFLLDVK